MAAQTGPRLVWVLLFLLYGLGETCEDLDQDGCAKLLASNHALCQEEVFAYTACARTCGNCRLMCYHCDVPLKDYRDCNTTRPCQKGEKCMLTEMSSSGDGHYEVRMNCAAVEMCDGRGIFIGRRDVTTHCCTDDLCNIPGHILPTTSLSLTTSTTPIMTTTTSTPTKVSCPRDIIFMIEDSPTHSDSGVKQLLQGVINDIRIGPNDSLVAVSLFDNHIHPKWPIDKTDNTSSLISKINALRFTHSQTYVSYIELKKAIGDYVNAHHHGDRASVPDVVIILLDHASSRPFNTHHGQLHDVDITRNSHSVIVITVGDRAQKYDVFAQYANNPSYVLNIDSYAQIPTIHDKLIALICQ